MNTAIKNFSGILAAALLAAAPACGADGYRALAKDFSAAAARGGVRKVAVLGLSPKGGVSTEETDYAAGKIAASLCAAKKVDVVERALLEKVLGEHRLMASLLSDTDLSKGLSDLIRAEAAVTGEVFAAGNRLRIAARLIDLRTGRVMAARELELERELPPADFRDSVTGGAPETCGDRRAELDRLNRDAVTAKAKYWAARLKDPGFSYATLRRNLGSELRDPAVKEEFYRLLIKFSLPGAAPEIKGRELALLHSLIPKEEIFYDECGL